MFDGGHGEIEEACKSLWNNYEVICLMEDIKDPLDKDTFNFRLMHCYNNAQELAQRHMKKLVLAERQGEEPKELHIRGILNKRNNKPYIWLLCIPRPTGNIDIYIIKGETKE